MKTETLVLLGVGAAIVYVLLIKKSRSVGAAQPQPTPMTADQRAQQQAQDFAQQAGYQVAAGAINAIPGMFASIFSNAKGTGTVQEASPGYPESGSVPGSVGDDTDSWSQMTTADDSTLGDWSVSSSDADVGGW